VNIAARMESNSLPGRINVSENTYQLLKHKAEFNYRGIVKVKNSQSLKMYFVEEEKEEELV
jgi:class 3 adenylate cyclase